MNENDVCKTVEAQTLRGFIKDADGLANEIYNTSHEISSYESNEESPNDSNSGLDGMRGELDKTYNNLRGALRILNHVDSEITGTDLVDNGNVEEKATPTKSQHTMIYEIKDLSISVKGISWRILNSINGDCEPDGDVEKNEDGLNFTMKSIVNFLNETNRLLLTINEEMK